MKNKMIKESVFVPVTCIDQLKDGDRIRCKITGEEVNDARISIDDIGDIYICQDTRNGFSVDDKKGYRFSWKCYNSKNRKPFKDSLRYFFVTDLEKEEI